MCRTAACQLLSLTVLQLHHAARAPADHVRTRAHFLCVPCCDLIDRYKRIAVKDSAVNAVCYGTSLVVLLLRPLYDVLRRRKADGARSAAL